MSIRNNSIVIIVGDFYSEITNNLLEGARQTFLNYGGSDKLLKIFRVPGAFEIPGAIANSLKIQNINAVIALGAIIRGETPHFDYISLETFRGIAEISRTSNIPVINGVLSTDSLEQAEARSIIGGRNKGHEAMEAALKTIDVYKEIDSVV